MSCCADCAKCNLRDTNCCKDCYCGEKEEYVETHGKACDDFVAREDEGDDCYITTIVVVCLGYHDYCTYLQTLRNFRDEKMLKDPKYLPLLEEYDFLGPQIAQAISEDSQRVVLAKELFEKYIKPVTVLIDKGNDNAAVVLYKNMVVELRKKYSL